MNKSRIVLAVSALLASSQPYAITDMGQAIQDMGGSDLLVRAGDAIYVTCIALDTTPTDQKTSAQIELNLRCADMTQQAFFLDPTPNQDVIPPAANSYGLAAGATDSYFSLLRQFSGEEASTQGRYATEGSTSQFRTLASRLSAIRRGVRSSGLAFNLQGTNVFSVADNGNDEDGLSDMIGGAAGSGDGDLGWAWFANVEYGWGERDGTVSENGYESDSYGVVLGADYAFNDSLVIGASININRAEVDFDRSAAGGVNSVSGGGMDIDSESLSVFANYMTGQFFASAIVTAGQGEIDMTRSIDVSLAPSRLPGTTGAVTSNTDSDQLATQLQAGYTFGETATTWDLYGGLEFSSIEIDSFAESGSPLVLSFGDQEIDSQQIFLGGAIRRAISTDRGVIVPYASLEYRYEMDNDSRSIDARYSLSIQGPTDTFQGETDNFEIPTEDADDSYFDFTVGVSAQFGNNLAAFAQINSLLGLEDTTANMITIGVRGSF